VILTDKELHRALSLSFTPFQAIRALGYLSTDYQLTTFSGILYFPKLTGRGDWEKARSRPVLQPGVCQDSIKEVVPVTLPAALAAA